MINVVWIVKRPLTVSAGKIPWRSHFRISSWMRLKGIDGHASFSSVKTGKKRGSRSITVTSRTPAFKIDRVREPGPGPTSSTQEPSRSPAAFTILLVNLKSRRKFWDKCFSARSRYIRRISPIVGNGGRRKICFAAFAPCKDAETDIFQQKLSSSIRSTSQQTD